MLHLSVIFRFALLSLFASMVSNARDLSLHGKVVSSPLSPQKKTIDQQFIGVHEYVTDAEKKVIHTDNVRQHRRDAMDWKGKTLAPNGNPKKGIPIAKGNVRKPYR
jgi:hypothetical protein